MEFLENVKSVLVKTKETVSQKSVQVYEASKIKYEILSLKNDVRKLYSEIGKLTYETIAKGMDFADDINTKCEIITAKLNKIAALNDGVSNDIKCPSCGCPTDAENENCESCGADLVVDKEAEVE